MRLSKKSQITLFILIGIITLIVLGFVIMLRSPDRSRFPESSAAGNSPEVNAYITECLEKTLSDSIGYIAIRGGYYHAPEPSSVAYGINIPFYWIDNKSDMPSIDAVQEGIGDYITDNIGVCINDFQSFAETGYIITSHEMAVSASLGEGYVYAELLYPVEVTYQDSTVALENFEGRVSTDLLRYYQIISGVMDTQAEYSDKVLTGYLLSLASQEGFRINIAPQPDDAFLYTFSFGEEGEGSREIQYNYLAKYDWRTA